MFGEQLDLNAFLRFEGAQAFGASPDQGKRLSSKGTLSIAFDGEIGRRR